MSYKAKDERKEYPKASEGQHIGLCVDFIGPWEAVDDFDKTKPYPIRKVAYVWQLDENRDDGKPFEIAREFSLTFGKKANLRKFIGDWRGKEIVDDEAKAGVEIDFKGKAAYLTVSHSPKANGQGITAKVTALMPLPKALPTPDAKPYERAAYWAKRIEEDTSKSRALQEQRASAAAAGAQNADRFPAPAEGLSDFPAALDDDSDESLPF